MKYRNQLPQLAGDGILLTDGGLETELVFLDGIELPEFSSVDLMRTAHGRAHLTRYYEKYLGMAVSLGHGIILESPTWRASHGWLDALGYTAEELEAYNRESIELLETLRARFEANQPVVISGCIGPESDGYQPESQLSVEEAEAYHQPQISLFETSGVDCISAMTICYPEEAIGIANASANAGLPCIISFTVETNGCLVGGQTLEAAIRMVDEQAKTAPVYYMINCAHPTHFEALLTDGEWRKRIGGIRANASKCSHEELDNSTELDIGNPVELAEDYSRLLANMPWLKVLGGCCGTDIRHIKAIAGTCLSN